jgi:hypothetical protein
MGFPEDAHMKASGSCNILRSLYCLGLEKLAFPQTKTRKEECMMELSRRIFLKTAGAAATYARNV